MEKEVFQFEDFLSEVHPDYKEFVMKIHESLQQDEYKLKIESKASGYFISYSHPKTRRSVLNFLFRKKGLSMRIYADHFEKYIGFLQDLPEKMQKEIGKAPVCKRLINPSDCNTKCVMGYDFTIRENRYQKCRYHCFQFEVNPESVPVIIDLIENERRERLEV